MYNLAITADSCRPDVYSKLRRGGNFKDLEENLEFISMLRTEINFKFSIRMVVQNDNFDEIEDFYQWATKYNVTDVEYLRISHWWNAFSTEEEFQKVDVLNKNHKHYQATVNSLKRLKSLHKDKVVIYHFNLE